MSDNIPTEIITDILVRLPIKSLLPFTLVCKLWYSIITNPKFITTHFDQNRKTTDQLFLRLHSEKDRKDHFLILPDDEKFNNNSVELDFTFMSGAKIVGTCSGLIFLLEAENNVIIWNPCIRKSVTLTLPGKIPNQYRSVIGFGFGFDLQKNVFKVVSITYTNWRIPPDVFVYKQGINKWTWIECALLQNVKVYFLGSQVFLNGAVHWIAYKKGSCRNLIIAFEMDAEVFRKISLPLDLKKPGYSSLSVTQFKDSLALFDRSQKGKCSIWWMRNYGDVESWTKLYNIWLPGMSSMPLGFRKNGELLCRDRWGTLLSCKIETKSVTMTRYKGGRNSLMVLNFIESMVLLKEGNDVPDW